MRAAFVSMLAGLLAAGCGAGGGDLAAVSQFVGCVPITKMATKPSPAWRGTVFTIVMENKSRREILGNKEAPFINALAHANATVAGYVDSLVHPSEPNYLEMLAGNTFDVADDSDPIVNHIDVTGHLVDQLETQGLSWKGYMESMGEPCKLESDYPYAAKHNPFVYFDNLNGWNGTRFDRTQRCLSNVVDYSQLDTDLASGKLPTYAFITPDMINDMHDGSIADGDQWLAREVPKILSSPAFNEGGVLFLTWDEGGGTPPADDPPMFVISANAKTGYSSTTVYSSKSYLRTVQKILGLQQLPCVPDASDATMDEFFSVPLDAESNVIPAAARASTN